jgi:hypothetical protein
MAWIWDHRESKPFSFKLLSLGHHLDDWNVYIFYLCLAGGIYHCIFWIKAGDDLSTQSRSIAFKCFLFPSRKKIGKKKEGATLSLPVALKEFTRGHQLCQNKERSSAHCSRKHSTYTYSQVVRVSFWSPYGRDKGSRSREGTNGSSPTILDSPRACIMIFLK